MTCTIRTTIALAAAAVACAGVPACATRGDPLAGVSGTQALNRAVSSLKGAPGFTLSGAEQQKSGPLSVRLRYRRGTGCEGTIRRAGQDSVTMIAIGKTVWAKPSAGFWKANGGAQFAADFVGKYIESSSAKGFGGMADVCDLNAVTTLLPGTVTKGPAATIDGQQVIPLTSKQAHATVYVTDTDTPRIVQVRSTRPGADSSATIAYGPPAALVAPPASQTVDGSAYGF